YTTLFRSGPPPTTRRLPHRAATPDTRSSLAGCANAACGGSPPTSPSSQPPSKRGVGVRLPRRRCVHRRRLSPLDGRHSPGASSHLIRNPIDLLPLRRRQLIPRFKGAGPAHRHGEILDVVGLEPAIGTAVSGFVAFRHSAEDHSGTSPSRGSTGGRGAPSR